MDEPLSNEELATAKGQMLIAGSLANNRNASVDIPTMLAGVRRMLATIDARDSTIATLTTERDAAEESRRFYIAERDRLREALEAQGSVIGRHGWHAILCHGYTGKDCTAECVTARRALAGTGETP